MLNLSMSLTQLLAFAGKTEISFFESRKVFVWGYQLIIFNLQHDYKFWRKQSLICPAIQVYWANTLGRWTCSSFLGYDVLFHRYNSGGVFSGALWFFYPVIEPRSAKFYSLIFHSSQQQKQPYNFVDDTFEQVARRKGKPWFLEMAFLQWELKMLKAFRSFRSLPVNPISKCY